MKTALATLALALNVACLIPVPIPVGGGAGARSQAANSAASSGDCNVAVNACYDVVATACDRAERCGESTFDDCVGALFDDGLDCDRAFATSGNADGCVADIERASCADLSDGTFPASCQDFASIGPDVCR